MSENLRSDASNIRDLIEVSDNRDLGGLNFPDDDSVGDYSSGSGELFEPNLDEASSSDEGRPSLGEVGANEPSNHDISRPSTSVQSNWVRAYNGEPPIDIESKFCVRHPSTRLFPSKNSSPVKYFILFFTAAVWDKIFHETNANATLKF
ncbi:hypothetical protein J6590_088283 [Homalodisca vitripennis]|nr:hypothetical protein J6590_088283 [Homalodisca vitripennis]